MKKTNNIEEIIKKPKYIEIAIIGGIVTIITVFAFYLFPADTKFVTKIIVCLSTISIALLILLIIDIIKFNIFYNEYKKQYHYFNNKLNKNNKNNRNIKKIKKDVKELKDKSLDYEIIDEW